MHASSKRSSSRAETQLSGLSVVSGSLAILAGVAIGFAMFYTKSVMIPFVLAIFITYLINPIIELLVSKLKFPKVLAITTVFLLGVLLLMSAGGLTANTIRDLIVDSRSYKEGVINFAKRSIEFASQYGIQIDMQSILDSIQKLPVFDLISETAGLLVDIFSKSFLVLIFILFLIIGKKEKVKHSKLRTQIDTNIRSYIITKATVSVTTGVLVGTVLALFGVNYALLFGILTFLLNFIPNIGSVIATLLPIPVILIQFNNLWIIFGAILIPACIQMIIGNVIEPKFMGTSLDLHPVTILLVLMFWGLLWGIPGMFLAVPITAVLKIVFEHFDKSRPIANVMAGRIG